MHKYFQDQQIKIWISLLLLLISFSAFSQKKKYADIRQALFSTAQLTGDTGPKSVNWIEGGKRFSFIDTHENGQQIIKSYDPANGKESVIFTSENTTFPDSDQPFSYRSFQWSQDSKYIMFQTNFRPVWRNSGVSDYFYYSLEEKSMKLVAKDAHTAEVSPDGKKVAYERDGNLFVLDFDTEEETQLTSDAQENVYNGRFGWVYEEEFGLVQGWIWSPDSRYLAYWQTDERQVPVFQMTDYAGQHPDYVKIPYPKAGDPNPDVRIGIIDLQDNSQQWMHVATDGGYIPRLYWTSVPGQLAVLHLNRAQNHLKLFFCQAKTGQEKLIMEEKADAWIDVFDFFAGIMHLFFFPSDRQEFIWISDRDGWSHMYRYDYSGKLINQVTQGEWEVVIVNQVDSRNNTIYYTSTEASPLERHLYAVQFDGKKKRKLTQAPGRHSIDLSPNATYYLDTYSNINTPNQVELWNTKGKMVEKMADNTAVKGFIQEHAYAPRELFSFTTSDGQPLDGYLIKPADFDESKTYPLILNIYGGPGAQSVYNAFAVDGWEQYLAQQGYVVASVNNRGSGGYGRKFEKVVYKNLGEWESKDFVETVQFLGEKPWIDEENMAIRGHSYGGYMASYTTLFRPGIFKAAIVGAPVTDWRLYDSIYTERYMGLLSENEDGYIQSAATTHAGNLNAHMLIAHSTMDENVHVQNTFQLVTALIDHGKEHELRIFPPGAHGVAYNSQSYVLLFSEYTDFLNSHLMLEKTGK